MKIYGKIILSAALSTLCVLPVCAKTDSDKTARRDSVLAYPFGDNLKYDQMTGSYLTIHEADLEKRSLGDIRNRLTGMFAGLEVLEDQGGFWSTGNTGSGNFDNDQISSSVRGTTAPVIFVDDIRMPFTQMVLDPAQIESITLVTDILDKAKLGPMASDGALYIKTKTGGYNTPFKLKINLESGVSFAGRVAEYADGIEYAEMNNTARLNAGYKQLYSPNNFAEYYKYDPYSIVGPNVDYKSLMYKNALPVTQLQVNASGGSDKVKYTSTITGLYSGGLTKAAYPDDYFRINVAGAMGAKLNDFIELVAGYNTTVNFRRESKISWNSYTNVPAIAYPLSFGKYEEDGDFRGMERYGSTATWGSNYYAVAQEGGFQTLRNRYAMIHAALNIDLGFFVPGLKSRTFVSYANFLTTTIGKSDGYLSYYWDATAEDGLGAVSPSNRGVKASSKSMSASGMATSLSMYEKLFYDWTKGNHMISANVLYSLYTNTGSGISYNQRTEALIGNVKYSFKDKYIIEAVGQYTGSMTFKEGDRFGFFPTVGLAWNAGKENFIKDTGLVRNLKFHVQGGLASTSACAFAAPYRYQEQYSFPGSGISFGPSTKANTWFGVNTWKTQPTTITRLGNDALTWTKIGGINAGMDLDLECGLSLDVNYYAYSIFDSVDDVTSAYSKVFGLDGIQLYQNWSSSATHGIDITLGYDKTFGDWRVYANANATLYNRKYTKLVTDNYLYDYQKKTGTSTTAIWGLECIGRYTDVMQLHTLPAYGSNLQLGDLIYRDRNEDGKIDDNDKVIIGNSLPKVKYAVTIGAEYKNFEFQMVGTGRAGHQLQKTNEYYWSGWGDNNYTAFVRDNIGGDYPTFSYIKSSNNFVLSDFWLQNGGWFKIQDVMLAYNIPLRAGNRLGVDGLKVSLKAQNLATFTKFKDLDPESLSAGFSSYPLLRTFSAGINVTF